MANQVGQEHKAAGHYADQRQRALRIVVVEPVSQLIDGGVNLAL